jgi:hypothetical protein
VLTDIQIAFENEKLNAEKSEFKSYNRKHHGPDHRVATWVINKSHSPLGGINGTRTTKGLPGNFCIF